MEILLMRTVESLGQLGDVVSVRPGYARNYLLPLGFGVPVTKANIAGIEKARARAVAEEKVRISDLKVLSETLSRTSVTVEGRANEEGHLFGSVNAGQIAKALRTKGFQTAEKDIRMEAPLKEIGVFDVTVHLHEDVNAVVKVWVVQAKPS